MEGWAGGLGWALPSRAPKGGAGVVLEQEEEDDAPGVEVVVKGETSGTVVARATVLDVIVSGRSSDGIVFEIDHALLAGEAPVVGFDEATEPVSILSDCESGNDEAAPPATCD